jgi:hypothetical protein
MRKNSLDADEDFCQNPDNYTFKALTQLASSGNLLSNLRERELNSSSIHDS